MSRGARVRSIRGVLLSGAGLAAVSTLAVWRLRNYPYPLDPAAAWRGASEVLAWTLPAALRAWLVVLPSVFLGAAALHRRVRLLTAGEAVAASIVLLWAAALLLLLGLGPIGGFTPWVLRSLLLGLWVGTVWDLRRVRGVAAAGREPGSPWTRFSRGWHRSPGARLAVLAFVLVAPPLALLQLGSPVAPFMDVLPFSASTQKIVTFRFYDPFDNDAAGLWSPTRQLAGCDAVFSLVALIAGLPGPITLTALMLPLVAFQILAVYLLGRRIHDGLAGGYAALFFLGSFVFRRTPDARGTALAFGLVAIGLAWFLVSPRGRDAAARVALGALALGIAVPVNPLIGGYGMLIASLAIVVGTVDGSSGFWRPGFAMVGAVLVASSQVFLGLRMRTPPLLLALSLAAGLALLVGVARATPVAFVSGVRRRAVPLARSVVIAGLVLYGLWQHSLTGSALFNDDWLDIFILSVLGLAGMAVSLREVWQRPRARVAAALPALGLWAGIVLHDVASPLRFQGSTETRSLASEVTTKMTAYAWGWWLAVAAGVCLAALGRRRPRGAILALAAVLVIYPLRTAPQQVDFDTAPLSVAETWAFHLTNAGRGYFGGWGDRRWVLSPDYRTLAEVLRGEIAAGRIQYDTHVLQVSDHVNRTEVALGTGISVDLVAPDFDPNDIWNGLGRARHVRDLGRRLAETSYDYVLVEHYPRGALPALDEGAYEVLLEKPEFRLLRRRPVGS